MRRFSTFLAGIGECPRDSCKHTAPRPGPVGTIRARSAISPAPWLPGAYVTIPTGATGAERHVTSNNDGRSRPGAGRRRYDVRVELPASRRKPPKSRSPTGRVSTVEVRMEVGAATEVVNVAANAIHVETRPTPSRRDHPAGIQELPLKRPQFLQLAFLEPGVTASPGSTSQMNSLFSVSILGGMSNTTAITWTAATSATTSRATRG